MSKVQIIVQIEDGKIHSKFDQDKATWNDLGIALSLLEVHKKNVMDLVETLANKNRSKYDFKPDENGGK